MQEPTSEYPEPSIVLQQTSTSQASALRSASLPPKKPNQREEFDNTSQKDTLLRQLLVNLFEAPPRKQPLKAGEYQEQNEGEKPDEQK